MYRSAAISGGIPLYPAGSAPERHRLVILMIEVEQPEGVSTRKLVLETARHNVITAYSTDTGLRLLRRFPNVDVVVVHTELDDFCIPPGKRRHFKQMLGLDADTYSIQHCGEDRMVRCLHPTSGE